MLRNISQIFRNLQFKKQNLLLPGILIVGALIRLWLLDKRWINPDEGAHIMDGVLVLEGLVPEVDFDARQPLYTYLIALMLKVFGMSYITVRLLPFLAIMGICLLVYLISKRLFDPKIALLATGIYTFLPLSVLESAIVKTEPLTALLSCVGVYLAVLGLDGHRRGVLLFFLSGVFLAMAFYVRESALAMLLALFILFAVLFWNEIRRLVKNYAILLSGFVSVCLVITAYFSQYLTISQIWNSPMNPLYLPLGVVQTVFGSMIPQAQAASEVLSRTANEFESWKGTVYYLNLTLFTHAFLLVGLVFSAVILAYCVFRRDGQSDIGKMTLSFTVLYSWVFSLGMAYLYWMIKRGYFIQYFEELLPPLAVLLAFVINWLFQTFTFNQNMGKKLVLVAFVLLAVFSLHRMFPGLGLNSITYVLVATLGLSLFYFSHEFGLKRWLSAFMLMALLLVALLQLAASAPYSLKAVLYSGLLGMAYLIIFIAAGLKWRRDLKTGLGFIAFSVMLSSSVLSLAVSGRSMGVAFDSGWSPQTVKETSEYLMVNSRQGDEIMSGAVIWELQSGRRPFMNVTHPLRYVEGIPYEEARQIDWYVANFPPKFIVLDGYTEKTYLRHINGLQGIMDEKYELKKIFGGSRSPVKIYELKDTVTTA